MFCHKCGTEIAEGAGFCHKCGTKVVHMGEQAEAVQTVPTDTEPPRSVPVQRDPIPTNQPIADDSEFRAFIDSHVRATTKYQSAQELLSSKVSQKYVWLCFGIPALVFGLLAVRASTGVVESLDGTNQGVWLDCYIEDERTNVEGSRVEDCYILEHMRDVAAIPNAQRQMQDDGSICYFFGDTTIRVTESMKDGRISLKPIAGNQVACGEWADLPIDRLHGYCFLLEKYLKGGENP